MVKEGLRGGVGFRGVVARSCLWGLHLTSALTLSVCLLSGQAMAGNEKQLGGWHTDFPKAEALAKKTGTPLLIHFHASWCGPCRAMDADVLHAADVLAALQSGIVGVKVDSDVHRDLVARFGVTALPTDIIVSTDGRVISKNIGSPGRSAYVARLMKFSVPAGDVPARSSTQGPLVAEASGAGNRVAAASLNETVEIASGSGQPSDTAIVALQDSVPAHQASKPANTSAQSVNKTASMPPEKPLVAMTKTLRRDSDQRIGLNGYSPVSLQESEKWKTGNAEFKSEFQGVCYLLSSAEELDRFNASPEKFVPALHGCDPVSLMKDQVIQSGHIELGVTYQSRVYFFSTKQNRDEFLSNPPKFAGTYNLAFFKDEGSNDT